MIISVDELRKFITTDKDDLALQFMLEGLESFVRQRTHNNFSNRETGLVEYPAAVKMAVVEIMRWKIKMKIRIAVTLKKWMFNPKQFPVIL